MLKRILKELFEKSSFLKIPAFGKCPKCGFVTKLLSSPLGKFIICSNPRCDYLKKV